ncbi:conserved hypothetical protein [Tenacibaculum maritimum]|uniref:nucleotidyl transferase AbiEii/AbiGii toxin family protein n=1 Tax=Tenacibaculum maritimum TaxID=107401 RepID=UPI0012E679FB|nr:nucleotidyl transferase AbiEii/AbiGii toxin family protein [Tenacibaculum maritimum]CAA0147843.1 conserved hypothetical protein [Tenacibaculum maritimum]
MRLHEYQEPFRNAIRAAADHFGIAEIFIEKDYWVTFALKQIFTNPASKDITVFKGGTSLSKCHKIIERFSEDIDLVIITDEEEGSNAIKKKLKLVTEAVAEPLTYVPGHLIENKKGKIRKLVYSYDKSGMDGAFGHVRDEIVVEVSSYGSPHPSSAVEIHSMITGLIASTGNVDLIIKYELEPFKVVALDIERTFCEKVISLVRFSYTETPLKDLADKVRHTYDLHQLLKLERIQDFLASEDFSAMLNQVGKDDDKAIPNDKEWLSQHPNKALIFEDIEGVWSKIKLTYNSSFKELLTGDLPNDEEVLKSLKAIKNRLGEIKWEMS